MERLELKHTQHYPIGGDNPIKIIQLGDEPEILTVNGVIDVDGELVICANGNDFDYNSDMKLLLRPMTDLYKPLEDGSIPIVELAKLATESYGEFEHTLLIRNNAQEVEDIEVCCSSRDLVNFYFKYSSAFSGFAFFSKKVDSNFDTALPVDNQLKLFEYLFKHHFNVYNLPEHLFVDINTIQD